jgi:hypothetical protein
MVIRIIRVTGTRDHQDPSGNIRKEVLDQVEHQDHQVKWCRVDARSSELSGTNGSSRDQVWQEHQNAKLTDL